MDDAEIQYVIENAKEITQSFRRFILINEQITKKLNNYFNYSANDPNSFKVDNHWGAASTEGLMKSRIKKVLKIKDEKAQFNIYPRYTDSTIENKIIINYSFGKTDGLIMDYFEEKLKEKYSDLDSSEDDFLIIRKVYSGIDFVNVVCKDAISIFEDLKEIIKSYCS